jgi:transcriptional regulator with XRE-family HTH domain
MIDGAQIRAAREAKGMTQQELAEKVGAHSVTISNLERGKSKWSSHMPEIQRALANDSTPADDQIKYAHELAEDRRRAWATPLQVLRTILCANPTAEQVLAALDANGLKIMPKGAGQTVERDAIDDPIGYIKDVLARHNLTPGGLALKVKISGSTLTRAMNDPEHKFVLSTRTLQKIKEWDNAQ